MRIRSTARASTLAVAIAAAGFTLLPYPALAAAPQAAQIEQQLAGYRRDRTELERSIEQADASVSKARASGDTRALNAAIAQRGRLRAELRALDATVRIVAGIAKDGAAATATYDATLQALQGRASDTATALRVAQDEFKSARDGRSELSVDEAAQALQLAARQYRNSKHTLSSFTANSAEIEAAANAARVDSRAAAAPRKSSTDTGSGGGGKPRKSPGTASTTTTTSTTTLLVTPTSESSTTSTEQALVGTTSTTEDSVFATLAAIAEDDSSSTATSPAPAITVAEPVATTDAASNTESTATTANVAATTEPAAESTTTSAPADTSTESAGTAPAPAPAPAETEISEAEVEAILAESEPVAEEPVVPEADPVVDEPVVAESAPSTEPEPASEPSDAELDAMIAGELPGSEPAPVTEPIPEPEPLIVQEPVVATAEPPPVPEPEPVMEPEPETVPEPVPIIATGTATLSWSVPVTRANGAPLAMSELRGYELYVMSESTGESQVIVIDDPLAANYTVSQLAPDTYHFAIAAVDSEQRLSELSEVVSKTIADTSVASAP